MYTLKHISTEKYKELTENNNSEVLEENSFTVPFKKGLYARVSIKYDKKFLLMFNPTVEIFDMNVDCYGKDLSVESFALKRSLNSVPDKALREICLTPLSAMHLALANLYYLKENFDKYYVDTKAADKPNNTKSFLSKKYTDYINNIDDDDDGGVKVFALN